MERDRLFGSQNFRILSNVTRLALIPPVMGVLHSETWQGCPIPKTGSTMYLLTGLTAIMVGLSILVILNSKTDEIAPYATPLLQGLIEAAEAFIHRICLILKYPAYLLIILSAIFAPIWALFTKGDEYQGISVAIAPPEAINIPAGTILSFIFMVMTTSGYQVAIYRSFRVLKQFDDFLKSPSDHERVSYLPVFIELVPSFTFYVVRVLRNCSVIFFNLLIWVNEIFPIKHLLYVFRPVILLLEGIAWFSTWTIWAVHRLAVLSVKWAANLGTTALFGFLLYFNSNNFLQHIGHIDGWTIARFAAFFLFTFYTFAFAYLFSRDMRTVAEMSA